MTTRRWVMCAFRGPMEQFRDERGIALPMAMLTLLILTTLVIAFSMLATSEPLIATNQKLVAQARAIAESGVERAIWALNNPADPNGLASSLPGTVPAPYDGSTAIPITVNGTQVGVVFVTVTSGTNPNERNITAVGWVPTNTGSALKAHQKIQTTVSQFLFARSPPPASLTVAGEINAGGHTNIDSRSDTSCGAKDGTWSQGFTSWGGSAAVYGADGNNTANQTASGLSLSPPSPQTDIRQNVPASDFSPYTLKNADLNTLKAWAKANGTYYSGSSVTSLTFNSGNQLPNGQRDRQPEGPAEGFRGPVRASRDHLLRSRQQCLLASLRSSILSSFHRSCSWAFTRCEHA